MLKKQKEIRTSYKVAVVANQLEKRIRKATEVYKSSKYQVLGKKTISGNRYIYVLPDSHTSAITSYMAHDVFSIVRPFMEDYRVGDICCGIDIIDYQDKKWPAIFVLVSKKESF